MLSDQKEASLIILENRGGQPSLFFVTIIIPHPNPVVNIFSKKYYNSAHLLMPSPKEKKNDALPTKMSIVSNP